MKKEYGVLIYKCRRCGELSKNCHTPNCLITLVSLIHGYDTPYPGIVPSITDIHNCKDGNMGVCDLIGSEYDNL